MEIQPRNFEEFEEDKELFDLVINDVPIWEWIRFRTHREIKKQTDINKPHTSVDEGAREHLKGFRGLLKNFFFKNPFFVDGTDFFFLGHPRRKQLADGYWWDLYCDPIYDACDINYIHYEYPYQLSHHKPSKTDQLKYMDLIKYGSRIQREIGIYEPSIEDRAIALLKELENDILHEFNAEIDILDLVNHKLHLRNTRSWMYKKLLERAEPSAVIIVVSYGKEDLIEVCNEMDIPVIELQHGIIHGGHFGYSFRGFRTKETFPDYLFVWGEFWKDEVDFPIDDENVIPVGYPYLEQQRKKHSSNSDDKILFISQGSIGTELSKFALEVDRHPGVNHDIVYKLHPGEYDRWQQEYPWLVDADIKVIDESTPPLYQLFCESSAQIGVYSTAIYEGLYFGLETLLYDCSNVENLQSLLDNGSAKLVSSASEVSELLGSASTQFERSYFFEPNSTDNICKKLNRIKNGR